MNKLNTKELMIGNIIIGVYKDGEIEKRELCKVNRYDPYEFGVFVEAINSDQDVERYDYFEGVPVMEERLKWLGFEKIYDSNFRMKYEYPHDLRFGYDIRKSLKNMPEGLTFRGDCIPHINQVHLVQNFFFAVTLNHLNISL